MDAFKPAKVVKEALDKAVEKVADLVTPPIPGTPGTLSDASPMSASTSPIFSGGRPSQRSVTAASSRLRSGR